MLYVFKRLTLMLLPRLAQAVVGSTCSASTTAAAAVLHHAPALSALVQGGYHTLSEPQTPSPRTAWTFQLQPALTQDSASSSRRFNRNSLQYSTASATMQQDLNTPPSPAFEQGQTAQGELLVEESTFKVCVCPCSI